MNQKQKNKEAMDNLLNGLTMPTGAAPSSGKEESQAPASVMPPKDGSRLKRGRPPRGDQWDTAYIVVNKERYGKIRAISQQSGKPIKDIVDMAFSDYIRKVEKANGVIRIARKTLELPPVDD